MSLCDESFLAQFHGSDWEGWTCLHSCVTIQARSLTQQFSEQVVRGAPLPVLKPCHMSPVLAGASSVQLVSLAHYCHTAVHHMQQ